MKVLLYLNSENTDFKPFGDISDILFFRLAGKEIIKHLSKHLVKAGIKGSLLVTGSIDSSEKMVKTLESINEEDNGMSIVYVPSSNLYTLLQNEEQVLVVNNLLFPSKDALESLMRKRKEKKLPAVLSQDQGGEENSGVFILDSTSISPAIECLTNNNGDGIIKILEEHLNVIGKSLTKLEATSPSLELKFSWNLLELQEFLMKEMDKASNIIEGDVETGVNLSSEGITVEKGAKVRSGSYIVGPVIIGEGATVGPNCYIRPFTFIGSKAVIGNAVEVKNSIIGNRTHVGHLSYVGDSIIGKKCNFGAGTKVANLKINDKEVYASTRTDGRISTGRRKLGIMMGDNCKTGINASLMPGIMLGRNSIVGAACLLQQDLEEKEKAYLDNDMKFVIKKPDRS